MTEIFLDPEIDLDEEFSVKGRYYLLNGTPCRSLLTITKNVVKEDKKLLVIMLNPGGSKPIKPIVKEQNVLASNFSILRDIDLVDAQPDKAQYQIMRVMRRTNFSKAYVINLFDNREPMSNTLYKLINEKLENTLSIFSIARKAELQKYLDMNIPIIIAWGKPKTKCAKEFADRALKIISKPERKVYAVCNKGYIQYPSPRYDAGNKLKIEWLKSIITEINK